MELVSVIIPTYKRPANLCRAIDSVIGQTYSNVEIIVVDDNGMNTEWQIETERILQKYILSNQIKYIKPENHRNGSYARNMGLKVAEGEYVNFLDDDDVFDPKKIEIQVDELNKRNGYDAIYCNIEICGKKRVSHIKNRLEGKLTYELLTGQVRFNTSSILFKKRALLDINGWDDRFLRHQDWELMVRFFRNHKICIANPCKYLLKKYHSSNVISKNPIKSIEYMEFFIKEMERDIFLTKNPKAIHRYLMERLSLGLMAHGQREGKDYFFKIFRYGIPSGIGFLKFLRFMLVGK